MPQPVQLEPVPSAIQAACRTEVDVQSPEELLYMKSEADGETEGTAVRVCWILDVLIKRVLRID